MRKPGKASMLAALLGGGGVLHLVRPTMYDWLVPPELGNRRAWVLASGVVEVGTAALLLAPGTRRLGGWSAAGLLLAPMVTAALDVARGR
jgi:uncharacterized membrane protein